VWRFTAWIRGHKKGVGPLIYWVWMIVAFAAGVGATLFVSFIASLPHAPRCTAMLRSGEHCWHEAGHSGPHETRVYDGSISQGYAWEDPNAGVHKFGFFRR
jgi:hypothetical protein